MRHKGGQTKGPGFKHYGAISEPGMCQTSTIKGSGFRQKGYDNKKAPDCVIKAQFPAPECVI